MAHQSVCERKGSAAAGSRTASHDDVVLAAVDVDGVSISACVVSSQQQNRKRLSQMFLQRKTSLEWKRVKGALLFWNMVKT